MKIFPCGLAGFRSGLVAGLVALASLVTFANDSPRADEASGYDPLATPGEVAEAPPRVSDFDVFDRDRDRTIPIRVHLPAASPGPANSVRPCPVVLFSHGLGGSREGSQYLAKHWSQRGYVGVWLQHPGSDSGVWQNEPASRRLAAMRDAASVGNLYLRVRDVPAVLNQLEVWNREAGHPLAGRLDLEHVGMSGHSFGAQTTQALSGQSYPVFGQQGTDRRIKAAVIMSPGSPRGRRDPAAAFAAVKIPWLLMTGTRDTSPIGGQTVESRLAVFEALPSGGHYELLLHEAEHSAFTDRPLPGDSAPRNPAHHRAILAVSTAFWDATLRDDTAARAWLDGAGPRSILATDDRWQTK